MESGTGHGHTCAMVAGKGWGDFMKVINVARDFSKFPGGRYRTDGEWSGERFRDDFLVPALEAGRVRIETDGTLGYGSSFLEECFGGLVRVHGMDGGQVLMNLVIDTANTDLIRTIRDYIMDADRLRRGRAEDSHDALRCLLAAWATKGNTTK